MKRILLTLICALTLVASVFAQPANDACGSAISLSVNGPCVASNSANATEQAGEASPSCDATQDGSIWYSFDATATSHDVIIDNTGFNGCAPTYTIYNGGASPGSCLPSTEVDCFDVTTVAALDHTFNLTGLTVGNTYFIHISTQNTGGCNNSWTTQCVEVDGLVAHCTNGVQDADETGVDCGGADCPSCSLGGGSCTDNEDCASAEDVDVFMAEPGTSVINDGDTMQVCGTDCNIGAGDVMWVFAGGCGTSTQYQQVWYTFVADNANLDIDITTDGSWTPTVGIFDACGGIYGCWTDGTGSTVSVSQFGLTPGNTYSIAVSSQADGAEGNFSICITDYDIDLLCNLSSTLTPNPPPSTSVLIPGGTYPPGTTVEFCYTVNQWDNSSQGGCQWIMGIAPSWGGCWDPATYTTTTTPTEATGNGDGTWNWIPSSSPVFHNTTLQQVNPNGYFEFNNTVIAGWGDGCPGDDWGHFGCNTGCDVAAYSGFTWNYCFELTTYPTEPLCSANSSDCSVSVETYSDGEVGSYSSGYCLNDPATSTGSVVSCCDLTNPVMSGTYTVDTSAFTSATTFIIDFDEPVICDNLDVSDFTLATSGFALGGTTITGITGNDCTGVGDTCMSATVTISAGPGVGYDHTWYIEASGTADATDVCGNPLTTAASSSVSILPAELLYFTGEYNGEDVELEWATATETNSLSHIVERSKNGIDFEPIVAMEAAHYSTEVREYQALDRYPKPGIMYYRLLMIDNDETYKYSNLIAVEITGVNGELSVYPNPATNEITMDFEFYELADGKLFVYDLLGEVVREKDIHATRGRNRKNIDISMLSAGTYFCEVRIGAFTIIEKITKQ